jgi:hypothetical protein
VVRCLPALVVDGVDMSRAAGSTTGWSLDSRGFVVVDVPDGVAAMTAEIEN